jgi:hypothetical protein
VQRWLVLFEGLQDDKGAEDEPVGQPLLHLEDEMNRSNQSVSENEEFNEEIWPRGTSILVWAARTDWMAG